MALMSVSPRSSTTHGSLSWVPGCGAVWLFPWHSITAKDFRESLRTQQLSQYAISRMQGGGHFQAETLMGLSVLFKTIKHSLIQHLLFLIPKRQNVYPQEFGLTLKSIQTMNLLILVIAKNKIILGYHIKWKTIQTQFSIHNLELGTYTIMPWLWHMFSKLSSLWLMFIFLKLENDYFTGSKKSITCTSKWFSQNFKLIN